MSFTSTTSLLSKTTVPKKDYASALASLQSSYGASGLAPVLPKGESKSKSKSTKSTATTVASRPSHSSTTTSPPKKDYASAFASLQSSYGFSGTAPSVPRR